MGSYCLLQFWYIYFYINIKGPEIFVELKILLVKPRDAVIKEEINEYYWTLEV